MDSLTISFLVSIGLTIIMIAITFFLLAKMKSLKKNQSVEGKNRQDTISNLQKQTSSLQNELTGAAVKLINAQRKINDLKDKEPRTIKEQRQLKNFLEATVKERDQLAKEKLANQEAFSHQKQALKQANAQLSELKETLHQKEQQLDKSQDTNLDITTKMQELESDIAQLRQEKQANEETISQQEQDLKQANAQLSEFKDALQEKEQFFQQLQGSNADTIEKVDALELQMQGLNQEKLANQEAFSHQKQALKQANAQLSELKETLHQKEQQLDKSQDTNLDITTKMQELESDIAQLRQEKQANEETISQQEQDLKQANAQLSEFKDALQEKEQRIQKLQAGDYAMSAKLKQAQTQIKGLEKGAQTQQVIIAEVKKEAQARENQQAQAETAADEKKEEFSHLLESNEEKLRRLLLEKKWITRAILKKALKFQKKYQGSLLQFLFVNREINEDHLTAYFSLELPYIQLGNYEILYEVVKLLPSELAEKHWMLPVDKMGNSLIVVMVDPFDNAAIEKIKELTGCKVQKYVGLFSEIAKKIQHFYKVNIRGLDAEGNLVSPLFIETAAYKGRERRRAIRFKADLGLWVAQDHHVSTSTLENVCWDGLSFELDHELPIYSIVTIELNMPPSENEEATQVPTAAVAQVIRAMPLENNNFMIGLKLLKTPKEDLDVIIEYASTSSSSGPSE